MLSSVRRRLGAAAAYLLVLCLCAAAVASAAKDYYATLEVPRDASAHEIKRQYKLLSRKHHPDKNPGDEKAHERFIELAEAYEVLSDDEKREIYNRYGEEGLKNQGGPGGPGGAGGFHDPFDIFAQFFGGNVRFDRRGARAKPRGPDVHIHVPVTLRELFVGTEIDVDISKQAICSHCDGSGAASPDDVETCSACGGSGMRVVKQVLGPGIVQQMQTKCDKCSGKGKKIAKPCPHCKGARVMREPDVLTVRVEPGMDDGAEILFEEEGDQHPDHEPGSVVFHLLQQPHETFQRHGDDLHAEVTITLVDALVGFSHTLAHVDGTSTIELRRKDITPPGYVQRLAGKGMPRRGRHSGASPDHGDLRVTYWVQFPVSIDSAAKEQVTDIFGDSQGTVWDGSSSEKSKGSRTHRGKQSPEGPPPQSHDEL
ncbi:DnaJ- protein scj1 [Coemansia sp. RSA 552]|nr:DnaJ- protein scj1 [Coemansia sp. RSA 552]